MIRDIQTYFDTILKPQLTRYGVSESYQMIITEVISRQMYSVLVNWDDQDFVKTLYLTVAEEAPFYLPDAKNYVKSFVVLTIRNSPIETLQSDNYRKSGLPIKLSDNQIREITSAAIRYFNKLDFSAVDCDNEYDVESDVYYMLSQKYGVAWNALTHVANDGEQAGSFQGLQYRKMPYTINLDIQQNNSFPVVPSIVDGFDPAIDNDLRKQIAAVIESRSVLSIDCFKMLSRNMEKILIVLDYLFQNQCGLVTSNYYIGNGYFEKRVPVIKAASSNKAMSEMKEHYCNLNGVGEIHKKYLMATVNGGDL